MRYGKKTNIRLAFCNDYESRITDYDGFVYRKITNYGLRLGAQNCIITDYGLRLRGQNRNITDYGLWVRVKNRNITVYDGVTLCTTLMEVYK